jgi:hypothetical protein
MIPRVRPRGAHREVVGLLEDGISRVQEIHWQSLELLDP